MLHRLIFVHFSGGTLNKGGGRQLLEARLARPTKGETLKTRYGFLEAAALWRVEMGEYAAAETFFAQAEEVMRSTPEVTDKVHMLANRGEQLALEGRLELAREYYGRARDALRPHHYWRAHQCVLGGLGYCALELGDLKLARLCEAALQYQSEAYFDPWIVVLFRATLLRRRGQQSNAADYLSSIAQSFEGRLRTVPIKLRLLECRLRQGRDRSKALQLAEWLIVETEHLQLRTREVQARSLLMSLGKR